MKNILCLILICWLGSFAITISGYNLCYVATDIGYDNLNNSSIGTHIDSAYDEVADSVSFRNIFENGYIHKSDWDGGITFHVSHDSVLYDNSINIIAGFIVNKEFKTADFGPGQRSQISYYTDSIIERDTIGSDNELYLTRNVFVGESLYVYDYSYTLNKYLTRLQCRASSDSCTCGSKIFKWSSSYYEEIDSGAPVMKYYLANGIPVSINSHFVKKNTNQIIGTKLLANGQVASGLNVQHKYLIRP